MATTRILFGVGALSFALIGASVTPAAAEFFGCKEPRTKVSYSRGHVPQRHAATSDDNRAYWAAQRSRHADYSALRSDRRARPDGWR